MRATAMRWWSVRELHRTVVERANGIWLHASAWSDKPLDFVRMTNDGLSARVDGFHLPSDPSRHHAYLDALEVEAALGARS